MQRAVSLAACILIAAGGAAAGRLALPAPGLRGHYYTNLTRSGEPIAVVVDRSLSTDTLDNGTAGVWPAFSVEWSGYLIIDDAGTYEFSTLSDDGSELEVADRIVVNNGGVHGPQEARGTIDLSAGVHPIRVRYEQAGGGFALSVNYATAGRPLAAIPAWRLTPDPLTYSSYRLRRAVPFAAAAFAVVLWVVARRTLRRTGPAVSPPSEPHLIDRPAVAIALIIVVGIIVRIVLMLGADPILWPDSDGYIESSGAIRNGRYFDHDPFKTLLYPYFLTAFLVWSGEPPMDQIVVGAQHGLGVITTVCFFLLGRPVFGARAALAGALILTAHTTQLFYELSILSEVLFGCLLAACLLPIAAFVAKPTVRGAVLTGLLCVVLTLTRPVAQWLVVVPAALVLFTVPRRREGWKNAVVALTIFAALMLPWAWLNQRQFGFFGVALGRGLGLFTRVFDVDRLEPPAHTRFPEVRAILEHGVRTQYSPANFVNGELRRRRYSSAQIDALMARVAMETIAEQPMRFTANSLKQWATQLGGDLGDEAICGSAQGNYVCSRRTQGYAREPFLNRPRHDKEPVRPWVVAYVRHFRIPMSIVVSLALFGLIAYVAGNPSRMVPGVFLALVIAYFTFIPGLAQSPQARYRLPIDGLLFMFAVFGLLQLVRQLQVAPGSRCTAATADRATQLV